MYDQAKSITFTFTNSSPEPIDFEFGFFSENATKPNFGLPEQITAKVEVQRADGVHEVKVDKVIFNIIYRAIMVEIDQSVDKNKIAIFKRNPFSTISYQYRFPRRPTPRLFVLDFQGYFVVKVKRRGSISIKFNVMAFEQWLIAASSFAIFRILQKKN